MGLAEWAQLAGAALSGSSLPWLAGIVRRRLLSDPKAQAEARKLNTETDGMILTRLYAEIERIDRELIAVRSELETVKAAALDEKTQLETENKRLRGEIVRLKLRVQGLEGIIKVKPLTPADKALLAEIDRKTANRGAK